MATSGSTNFTITGGDLVKFALRKINRLASTEEPAAEVQARALIELNFMLKEWMIHTNLWRRSLGVITLRAPAISGITLADPAVVTTTAAHNLQDGSRVTIASVAGMTEINGLIATVANKASTTFEMSGIDSSGFTAWSSGGVVRPLAYALPTDLPFRVTEARFRQVQSSVARDIPMTPYTWTEYFELPVKGSTGISTNFHFNPGRGDAAVPPVMHVWPILASVTTESIEFSFQRRFEDIDNQANNIDIPAEFFSTAGYNLAARLLPDYGKDSPTGKQVIGMADQLLNAALDADRDDFVQMEPDERYG